MARVALLLFTVFLTWAADATPEVEAAETPTVARTAALITIDGPIDPLKAAYFARSVKEAIAGGATLIVSQLTTDGGRLDSCLEMVDIALDAARDRDDLRFVAIIEGKAWSAGAFIAYAHQEVYMTPGSHIGDIGVITMGSDGEIKYLPEKIESPVRAHMRTVAEANGWSHAKLLKMTARNQELYRFDGKDGDDTQHFVIQDDLETFLADNPQFTTDDKILVLGEDRLISYTAKEAVEAQMATGLVNNLDALWEKLGIGPAQILNLAPTANELTAWTLAGWAPLLASLAVLFIIFELKTPGVGIWAILAACSAALFFFCQYYLDLANSIEVILVVIGITAIILELFILPTGGLLGIAGAGLAATGLVLAFIPDDIQFRPGSDGFNRALQDALFDSMLSLVIGIFGIIYAVRIFPHTRAARRLATLGEIGGTSAGERESHAETVIGRRVQVASPLRPAGTVLIDGEPVSATSEHGTFVDSGSEVEIIAMRFGEAVVRPVTTGAET